MYSLPDDCDQVSIHEEIHDTCRGVTDVLGPVYTPEGLISYVKAYRKRPVTVRRVPMPLIWGGLCIALLDQDLILLRDSLDEVLEYQTLGHEAGHLLSHHVREVPYSLDDVIANPRGFLDDLFLRQTEEAPNNRDLQIKEFVAEEIGIILSKGLIKDTSLPPDFARSLFGDTP
jgi:hypothetical protein